MNARTRPARTTRPALPAVVVDRVACTGHGVCAAVLEGAVTLDEWGYPIVHPGVEPDPEHITAAVTLCPARALLARRSS